ncbi:MAG: lysoplasmalogenase [Candidatus Dormibacterales bacterium]
MNQLAWGILVLTAIVAIADWTAVARSHRKLEYAAKPTVMLGLIALAVVLRPASSLERACFIGALTLGLVSDVLMMLPGDRFLGGLVAALVEHLAYIAGFLTRPFHFGLFAVAAAVALASSLAIVPPVYRAVRKKQPRLAAPILTYALVFVVMVARAGGTGSGVALAGALAFLYSDCLLAWNRFVAPVRFGRLANIVVYHAGQTLLVLSLAA